MDRIKQALDKARVERETASQFATPLKQTVDQSAAAPVETAIQYSRTKVVTVDQAVLRENKIIYGDADRDGLTAYKMLRTQVLQRMTARNWNAFAITSPAPDDGKSLTSINLAISLARELHHTVLLVDLDLRNPSIHRYFGLQPDYGIEDYLLNGVSLSEILLNPDIERLVVLPAKSPIANSSELLASPLMGTLVQELKSRYPSRLVLFDLPPILSADDALSFAPHIDAFLLVLRDAKTTRAELEQAMDVLSDVPLLGTVLNGSVERNSVYY